MHHTHMQDLKLEAMSGGCLLTWRVVGINDDNIKLKIVITAEKKDFSRVSCNSFFQTWILGSKIVTIINLCLLF